MEKNAKVRDDPKPEKLEKGEGGPDGAPSRCRLPCAACAAVVAHLGACPLDHAEASVAQLAAAAAARHRAGASLVLHLLAVAAAAAAAAGQPPAQRPPPCNQP